ncbi:outer membrane beta-barrel protein [Empedobacter brevis]|uniref:outer membrane beta-barrel protein n=1 Tax=Empedobacter brevis TaxID=247 RepID=UPI0039B0ADB6
MKKIVLLVATVFAFTNANAQENEGLKGKWFLMGQAGYGTSNDGDTQNYSILPAVGHFISPSVAVGGAIGYVGSKDDTSSTVTTKGNKFIVQPLVRKYWGVNDKLFIFGQASVPLLFGKNTYETVGYETDIKYTGYGIEIAPGLDYFLSSNWSIETSFGLASWNAIKPKDGDATNDFNFGLNSGVLGGVKIGVKYIF